MKNFRGVKMKKTMIFETEIDYENWVDEKEEKECGRRFFDDRIVIVKGTSTIQLQNKNSFFSAEAIINCKNVNTAIRRFIKELNSNGFNVCESDFDNHVKIDEIDDFRFFISYRDYQEEPVTTDTPTVTAEPDTRQTITSARTSRNQIPCTAKLIDFNQYKIVLDYGCGKYDTFKNYIEGLGLKYYGYDPYHKTEEENKIALNCKPDLVTCNNVLNVINNDNILDDIIYNISQFNCTAIFCVYEGDKSGRGKLTLNDCYQRNEPAINYIEYLSRHFNNIKRKGNMFICNNEVSK